MLLTETLEEYPIKLGIPLPSPFVLRRKILVKNKIEKKSADQMLVPDRASISGLHLQNAMGVGINPSKAFLQRQGSTRQSSIESNGSVEMDRAEEQALTEGSRKALRLLHYV